MIVKILQKIKRFLLKIKSSVINFVPNSIEFWKSFKFWLARMSSFLVLLISYLLMFFLNKILTRKFVPLSVSQKLLPPFEKIYFNIVRANNSKIGAINRVNLIEIALKNLMIKKTRTFITVGGMSLGIATIVFLVSLGYGLQKMVTSRVARLEEMKQANISSQVGSNLKLDDSTIELIKEFPEVDSVLPMIELVGKINYKNSVTDTAVFAVTRKYLEESAIKPTRGKIFDSEEIGIKYPSDSSTGEVAGISTVNVRLGQKEGDVTFSISYGKWVEVREEPREDSKLIGFSRRVEGHNNGVEYWGSSYSGGGLAYKLPDGADVKKWIYAKVPVWELKNDQYTRKMNNYDSQDQSYGYIAEKDLLVSGFQVTEEPIVLGVETSSDTTQPSSDINIKEEGDEWVSIEGLSQDSLEDKVMKVPLGESAKREAVVNKALLRVFGIDENNAVGQKFEVSFIIPSVIISTYGEKVNSEPAEYTIVGVIPTEDVAYFYVPLIDIKTLGVNNYSQIKMTVKNQNLLASAREKIETRGYITSSVVDTINQINSLFITLRQLLALIGTVALSVAALGMFNTLTVSLLERIREIGLMKAMGMRSDEVRELFLTESMVMGFFGGISGLIFGFLAGKLLGLALSFIAVFKGVGFIDISFIPVPFVILIVVLSLMVGFLTGIYPSRRATQVSALNALRYE